MTILLFQRGGWIAVAMGLVLLAGCHRKPAPEEGVYTSPREVFLLYAEVLELSQGRFRYWSRSDVILPQKINWPMVGKYRREGNRIFLETDHPFLFSHRTRRIVEVAGITCLLRDDAEKSLQASPPQIAPYGWMLRASYPAEQMLWADDAEPEIWGQVMNRAPQLKAIDKEALATRLE